MAITKMKILTILSVFVVVILITSLKGGQTEEIPRITKEEAKELLDNPHTIFLDVRAGSDWRASDMKITGALREDSRNLEEWIVNYDRQKTYILYCA
jgi:rhodanese-related sulfurtransferase